MKRKSTLRRCANDYLTHTKRETGITLIALVITIIILLILAGISIATLTGSGLFEKTRLAKDRTEERQKEEEQILVDYQNKMSEYITGNRNYNPINYSTEEQDTGMKWIDGATIYQKTIDFGNLPNSSIKNVPHNIENLDKVINFDGFVIESSTVISPLTYVTVADVTYGTQVYLNGDNIAIATKYNKSSNIAFVTLKYTKKL